MALLNRLFSSRKKQSPQRGYVPPPKTSSQKSFNFSRDQVRVLLFRECERRGRKLLFDSKAVKKVPLSNASKCGKVRKTDEVKRMETSFVEISNGYGYQYTRPSGDVKSLGEMVFGSVAMTLRGSTFKVHIGGSPPLLMITRVTNSPGKRVNDRSLEDSCGSSICSMSEYIANPSSSSDSKLCQTSGSYPLDVPLPSSLTTEASRFYSHLDSENIPGGGSIGRNLCSLEGDSGCYTSSDCSVGLLANAVVTSPDSRKGSGGSVSSLRRRWLRTASTSIDLGSAQSLTKTDSLVSSSSLQPSGDDKVTCRTKLGVALVINLTPNQKEAMQNFLLEHGILLESMTLRLHAAVERAYNRKALFVSMMVDASSDVEQSIEDLMVGPKLPGPIWLSLTASDDQPQPRNFALATSFLQELCQMIDAFDTKDTNFFMSTLLTAVLTHHLGWVPSIAPSSQSPFCPYDSNGKQTVPHLAELNKIHPYNPLWAQAMDLYGALGHPLKTARTIVMSVTFNKSRLDIIEKLLRIISYFIRCASIERNEPKLEEYNISDCLSHLPNKVLRDSLQPSSIGDRVCSSSTLKPLSRSSSTRMRVCSGNAPVSNGREILLSNFQKPLITDHATSRSENTLDIAGNETIFVKQPVKLTENGLRRTMSYSSKLSSSFKICGNDNCGIQTELPSSDTHKLIPLKFSNQYQSAPHAVEEEEASTDGKVIFVLGENEDLTGLKNHQKDTKDVIGLLDHTLENRGKIHEQPLSFSGSEVESGFSDCESFELSPGRSISENALCSPKTSSILALSDNQALKLQTLCSKLDNGISGLKPCNGSPTNTLRSPLCRKSGPKVVTVHSAYIEVEKESEPSSLKVLNFRSLARSLSVNLPISFRSTKQEKCSDETCIKCGRQVSDEFNVKSSEKKHDKSYFLNSFKRLSRACSFGGSLFQDQRFIRSSLLCQKCGNEENSCLKENILNHQETLLSVHSSFPMKSQCSEIKKQAVSSINVTELPLPSSNNFEKWSQDFGVAGSLFGGVSSHYMPERVLQGCAPLGPGWELSLKRDLALDAQRPTLDSGISESVAIVANVDTWEVQLISSHTYVVDRPGTIGVRVSLSHLVANTLESVYHMWKLQASPELCLSYLEGRLREMWVRSQALSELLLTTEFCDMDLLTSSLSLDPNDVPLLLSVASTHTPEVTQRYGLSFR